MAEPGTAVFRRLSRLEYNNTVRDLLGDTTKPAESFTADPQAGQSGYRAGGNVSDVEARDLFNASEKLADAAAARFDQLLPCKTAPAAASDQESCARDFINAFGKRAFRRPLTDDEKSAFMEHYTAQRTAGADFNGGIKVLITSFLLSPQFLYRWEVTPKTAIKDGAYVRYNGYEMASRLSYLLWASMPDDKLFDLAEQNKLSTVEQIEAEARRLLGDSKAKVAMADFFTQWIGVSDLKSWPKDEKIYPGYQALIDPMFAETSAFAANIVTSGDGKMASLFTSTKTYVDANLAKLYGMNNITSKDLVETDLPADQRAGILTQGAFLFGHASPNESNPPRRGKAMTDQVLCQIIPLPDDAVPKPEEPDPTKSVRERYEKHAENPCASTCHKILDPLGYAFEHYNGIGAFQERDGGKPVNATGVLQIDETMKPFKDAIEFSKIVGSSKQVAGCMTRQFLRYALRRVETRGDEPSIAQALGAFAKDGSLRDMFLAFIKTPSFTHRKASEGEVLQ